MADPETRFPSRLEHADFSIFGRQEVVNYLISNARFWLGRISYWTGCAVDAVAVHDFYLDYRAKNGGMIPSMPTAGNQNWDYCRAFLTKAMNPGCLPDPRTVLMTVGLRKARAWPGRDAAGPIMDGSGFGYKVDTAAGMNGGHAGIYA